MAVERKGLFQFAGRDVTLVGEDIRVGQKAPDFTAQAKDWSLVNALASTRGKVRIIASLPSLNTSVCDRETRRFNQAAASLSKDIVIITVSTDLPFMIKSWCGSAGVDQVLVLSDHMETEFGEKYGVLIKENRIFRRAVFVIDQQDTVVYVEYLPVLGDEPDYDKVLSVAQQALA